MCRAQVTLCCHHDTLARNQAGIKFGVILTIIYPRLSAIAIYLLAIAVQVNVMLSAHSSNFSFASGKPRFLTKAKDEGV